MASSDNLASMEPWTFRPAFADSWISEAFARDTETLTKALQKSLSNNVSAAEDGGGAAAISSFFNQQPEIPMAIMRNSTVGVRDPIRRRRLEGVEEDDDDDVYHGRSGEFPADGAAGDRSQIPRRKLPGSGAGAVEAGAAAAERQPRSAGTGVLAHSRHVGFSTRPPPHPPTTGLASLRRRV
ncbi:hypothetical protein C3L33_02290, partial [Rhododendron williamsianum]